MDKKHIGLILIIISILLAKFMNLSSLDTISIALLMFFSALAWVGVLYLIPNPSGANFKMWKMILKGTLGMGAMILILVLGLTETNNYIKEELEQYGVTTEAIVISKDYNKLPAKRGKVNYIYSLTLKFQDEKNIDKVIKSEVSENHYKYSNVGTSMKIIYSSRNIDIHKLIY